MKSHEAWAAGLLIGIAAVALWNSQQKPPKVRVMRLRIHHGLVGAGLVAAGSALKKPALQGMGIPLVADDIGDIADWLSF